MFSKLRSWWQDTLLQTVLKNTGYLFSSNSAALGLSMLQSILAARLLGAEGFGLISATVIPFVSTINRLTSFRMSELVVKYTGQYLTEGKQAEAAAVTKAAALVDLLASLFGFLILVLLAPLAATYLAKDPNSAPLFYLYGLVILANGLFETGAGVLQVANRFGAIAAINLGQTVVTTTIILGAFLADGDMLSVLLAYLLGKSLAGLATAWLAYGELRRQLGAGFWRISLRQELDWRPVGQFAISTNLHGTLNLITRDSETLWVAYLRSPLEAGYFRIAQGVINLVMTPTQPLISTTYTEVSRSIGLRAWDEATGLLRKVTSISAAWTLAVGAFLVLFGEWAIGLLYGAEYTPAYPAVVILLIGYGFANILFWNRPLLLALGHPAYPLRTAAAFGLVKVSLALWLVPVYGYLAEAWLLTGFFLTSISANVLRGIREVRRRRAEGQLSYPETA